MFNNVWFYILLYMVIGTIAIIVNAKVYKYVRNKIDSISWGAALEFENKTLIHSNSIRMTYCLLLIAYVLWPVFLIRMIIKGTRAYRTIMRAELKKKEWLKQFEKIQGKWFAQ